MPLREHLAELRRRLVRSGIAIILASVAGWYLYSPIFKAVQAPLQAIAEDKDIQANIAYTDVMQAFNLHLKIAVYLGIVIASPIWLYQAWAFVVPGLTTKEKRRALAFSVVGAPLFVGGIYIGWLVVPNAVGFFASQAEPGTSVLPSAGEYLGFVTQLLLVFGVAFLLPLVLVALNLAGVMSASTMAKGWRVAVFVIFLFAAIASPTPDAGSMLALALPMVGLYLLAVGFSWLVDRRRASRDPFAGLSDDEASPLALDDDVDPMAANVYETGVYETGVYETAATPPAGQQAPRPTSPYDDIT